jgi:hypothetical protein
MDGYRSIMSLVVCLILNTAIQIHAQPQYAVTDLGTLQPIGVTAGPRVFGNLSGVPVVWWQGQLQALQHYGSGGDVWEVASNGEAVGDVWQNIGGRLERAAAFWDASGRLFGLPGRLPSVALGLSNRRVITGQSPSDSENTVGARWYPEGHPQDTGYPEALSPMGGRHSYGVGVDGQDRVWGTVGAYPDLRITVWKVGGEAVDLGTLSSRYAELGAVNEAGVGVGFSGQPFRATLEAGLVALPEPLPTPPNRLASCHPLGINNANVAVGWCEEFIEQFSAILWPHATSVVNLNDRIDPGSGWVLEGAHGLSDGGHIVGTGKLNGQPRGFLLTPIPPSEPPSLALLLNQSIFQPGKTLRMALHLRNPGPILTTDAYVGVIFPDGQTVLWLTNTAPLEGVTTRLDSNPNTFALMLRNVSWPAGLNATQQDYLTHTFTGLEPIGTYHFVVGWVRPGSLSDGRIDEGDILALAWAPFSFSPGQLIAGR